MERAVRLSPHDRSSPACGYIELEAGEQHLSDDKFKGVTDGDTRLSNGDASISQDSF
jgi:hypothetical protein